MKKKTASQSAFFTPRVLIGAVCVVGALLAVLVSQGFTATPGHNEKAKSNERLSSMHKVSVTDRHLVDELKARGARVVADYGSYVLLEATEQQAADLTNNLKARIVDDNNLIFLNAGTIDTRTPESQALRSSIGSDGGKQMRLIQFAGPIRPEWYRALENAGVRIVTYIPTNSYLVYGTPHAIKAVRALATNASIVQWDGEYTAAYRIDPAISRPSGAPTNLSAQGNEQFTIQLVDDDAENAATIALIDSLKLEPLIQQEKFIGYVNITGAFPREAVMNAIAARGDVVSIQPWANPIPMCERQDQIMAGNLTGNQPTPGDYLAYLTSKGFDVNTPSNFGVNVSDSGLDNGTTTPFQFLLYKQGDPTSPANSRVLYVRGQGNATAADLQGCHGHGNINTTIIGGYVPTGTVGGVNFSAPPHADATGFRWGLGIAPFVTLGNSVIFNVSGTFTNPNIPNLESQAYQSGMRISSNSWGSAVNGAYNATAQTYDALVRDVRSGVAGNQEYTIVFSAGNAGAGAQTIGSPGTGKNIITVGAAEDVNPFGGSDGCGTSDAQANSADDIIPFSSRGPTTDGRKKPDIMGPGTHVSGGAPQASIVSPTGSGTGAQLPCFNGGGVCGGIGGSHFFPAGGQQWYTASSGTSHSCPAVAGSAALIRQHFINQGMTPPSPAMTRGLLMNAARYMTGLGANDTLFSNNQGMGEVNMNTYFDIFSSAHILRDEMAVDMFTASGQQRTISGTVADTGKPVRITIVWTEPPGPTSGNAFINNIDLEVTVGGNTYLGNNFTGAFSSTGGAADTKDNVESVFLPAGQSGPVTIAIKATNIAGDGVPGNGQALDQDYAIVVYNVSAIAVNAGTNAVSAESCSPGNGAVDPNETVTVDFGLINGGSAATTNLVATLEESGGVTLPGGPQNYGAIPAGAQVSRPFTFTAGTACGETIVATLHLQDGSSDLGVVTFSIPTGLANMSGVASENFDSVTAPALPNGWNSNATGAEVAWVTSITNPETIPNAAFAPDSTALGESFLVSPTINIPAGDNFQLSFRNLYNMENGFDGAVLEVSVNGGTFDDVITAGGSFVIGGYNNTISTGFMSPIAGRMAWTGLSGGTSSNPTYKSTVVNLPPSVSGQPIQLRWHAATDSGGAATGQSGVRVDEVSIAAAFFSCCTAAPTPSPSPTPTPTPTASPTASPTPIPSAQAINLSTRLLVQGGDSNGIGGFIVLGNSPKTILIRGIGPSLTQFGIPNALANPALELHGPGSFITLNNNDWRDNQAQQIIDTGIPPTDDLESAILVTLDPGSYTAIIKGQDGGTGVCLIEVYDLSVSTTSKLGNISTRAFVSTGNDAVIAGFILGNSAGNDTVVIRGIGPSLADFGVPNVLSDPILAVRNAQGAQVAANNDWQDSPSQAQQLQDLGLAPTNALEAALIKSLAPGSYTAILSGVGDVTGNGLVEVYDNPGGGPLPTPGPTATPCADCTPTPTPVPGTPTPTATPGGTTPPPPTATPTATPDGTPGTCVEAFDTVAAPGLPAGWVASNPDPGDGVVFVTVTAPNDTAPNSAFIPDQDGISDKVLDSRPVNIQTANSVMTFKNNFNSEFSDGVFWDGGVLEVSTPSISGGDFLDITDSHVGGSITAGGYTGELSGDASNPLSGRMAWSGSSSGFITTTINMGANLAGQTVTLRFRFGSDEAVAAPGWWVDTISITDATCP